MDGFSRPLAAWSCRCPSAESFSSRAVCVRRLFLDGFFVGRFFSFFVRRFLVRGLFVRGLVALGVLGRGLRLARLVVRRLPWFVRLGHGLSPPPWFISSADAIIGTVDAARKDRSVKAASNAFITITPVEECPLKGGDE